MALRQHHALQDFRVACARPCGADLPGEPAEVVIPGERGQAQRRGRAAFVEPIVLVQPRQHRRCRLCPPAPAPRCRQNRNRAPRAVCRRACGARAAPRRRLRPRLRRRCGSAGMPRARARLSMAGTNACQNSGFTWRAVSMRNPSMPITLDPVAVDVDETLHDARVLRHQVVEAEEVAHHRALAPEVRVAAVVIVDRRVEPAPAP